MAHGSMSKTLVLILAVSVPIGYVIWVSQRQQAARKQQAPASSASDSAH